MVQTRVEQIDHAFDVLQHRPILEQGSGGDSPRSPADGRGS
jgi:hypothetical protein